MDIYIGGVLDRHAALHGDVVMVELFPPHQWKVLYDSLDEYLSQNPAQRDLVLGTTTTTTTTTTTHTNTTTQPLQETTTTTNTATAERDSASATTTTTTTTTNASASRPNISGDGGGGGGGGVEELGQGDSDVLIEEEEEEVEEEKKQVRGGGRKKETASKKRRKRRGRGRKKEKKEEEGGEMKFEVVEEIQKLPSQIDTLTLLPTSSTSFHMHPKEEEEEEEEEEDSAKLGRAVAPDELTECESEDNESGESESLNYDQLREDHAFCQAQWEAEYGPGTPQGATNTPGEPSTTPTSNTNPMPKAPRSTEGRKSEDASAKVKIEKDVKPDVGAHRGSSTGAQDTPKGRKDTGEDVRKKRRHRGRKEKGKGSKNEAMKVEEKFVVDIEKGGQRVNAGAVGVPGGGVGGGTVTPQTPKQTATPTRTPQKQPKPQRTEPTIAQIKRLAEWDRFIQRTGHVVYISERKHPRLAAGALKTFPDRNPVYALFAPTDHRVPRMKVPFVQLPGEWRTRFADVVKDRIFLCRIAQWTEPKYAMGELIRVVGDVGDLEAETEAILLENGVEDVPFPPEALTDLPELPWDIPEEELSTRTDLRQECIFTIDPPTARDLDDAISCTRLSGGRLRVGVHIADVSFFVREGSALDDVAAQRATSVYLVDKVVPMLPRALSEGLCSLVPGGDKLAVSVVWEVGPGGEVLSEWFGRTVIRSCAQLTYAHAQAVIDAAPAPALPPVAPPHTPTAVAAVVEALHGLASTLRRKRFEGGALHLHQPRLAFTLDPDTRRPLGLLEGGDDGDGPEAHHLVEELMLMANMAAAQRIYEALPSQAVLRRHPPPLPGPMHSTVRSLAAAGVPLDASSAGALQASLEGLSGAVALAAASLCSRPMQNARYFTPGAGGEAEQPAHHRHYALSVARYTHFTSPIRRFPDILVHRLLTHTLTPPSPAPTLAPPILPKICEHCNDRKRAAKTVQEASGELCLGAVVRRGGALVQPALALQVLDHSFDALLTRLGLVRRVYTNALPLTATHYTRPPGRPPSLTLHWAGEAGRPPLVQEVAVLTQVEVVLKPLDNSTLKFQTVLLRPAH